MGRDDNTSLGAREFGATLALPIWIDYMKAALKNEPVVTLQAPAGVQEMQGDWLYDEFVGGGYISYLGMNPGNPPSVQVAGSPREPASEPDGSAGTTLQPSSPNAILLQPVPPAPPGQSLPIQRIPAPKPAPSAPVQEPFQHLAPGLR
jgi:penicillin-binding protein 1A